MNISFSPNYKLEHYNSFSEEPQKLELVEKLLPILKTPVTNLDKALCHHKKKLECLKKVKNIAKYFFSNTITDLIIDGISFGFAKKLTKRLDVIKETIDRFPPKQQYKNQLLKRVNSYISMSKKAETVEKIRLIGSAIRVGLVALGVLTTVGLTALSITATIATGSLLLGLALAISSYAIPWITLAIIDTKSANNYSDFIGTATSYLSLGMGDFIIPTGWIAVKFFSNMGNAKIYSPSWVDRKAAHFAGIKDISSVMYKDLVKV